MSSNNPWDDRYAGEEFFYGSEPNDFLAAEAQRIAAGGKVLCLAEGEGRNAVFLAKQGYDVTGVDGSSVGLQKAKALAAENGVAISTITADLADYDLGSDAWDGIVSIWCHVPPALRQDLHRRIAHALKPGGVLILEAYHPRQLEFKTGGPPVAELMMTVDQLQTELQGLDLVVAQEIDRDIHEGRGHEGPSAVTQVIGVRPE